MIKMNIFFKYEHNGDLVLKGYYFGIYFEFQSYYKNSTIHFPISNRFYVLKETELPHYCSFMSISEAKWLIRKGYIYYLISKIINI